MFSPDGREYYWKIACLKILLFHCLVPAGLLGADVLDEALGFELGEDTVDGGKGYVEVIRDVGAFAVGMFADE